MTPEQKADFLKALDEDADFAAAAATAIGHHCSVSVSSEWMGETVKQIGISVGEARLSDTWREAGCSCGNGSLLY